VLGQSENELAGKISDIDNSIFTLENNVKSDVNKLVLEKERRLADIQSRKNMTQAQKAAAIDEARSALYQSLLDLKQMRINRKMLLSKATIIAI